MALWCTMGAPLILSMNVRDLTDYDLETYSNAEAIAIDQVRPPHSLCEVIAANANT